MKVAVLDDYQDVVRKLECFSELAEHEVTVFTTPPQSQDELVERLKNPNDGRGFIISLTQKGFTVIDAAIADHVATQDQLTEGLSTEDKHALNSILTRYLKIFEG